MRKILAVTAVFIAGAACGLILNYGPLHAQEPVNEDKIMTKLDDMLKAQEKSREEVLAAINYIKEELRIIKIRITQSQ